MELMRGFTPLRSKTLFLLRFHAGAEKCSNYSHFLFPPVRIPQAFLLTPLLVLELFCSNGADEGIRSASL